MTNIEEWQKDICKWSKLESEVSEYTQWLHVTESTGPVPDRSFPEKIFSKFTYKKKRSGEMKTVYIEPLATNLRHPYFCKMLAEWGNSYHKEFTRDYVMRKEWLHIDWKIGEQLQSASSDARML
jgi:hypothetical protein